MNDFKEILDKNLSKEVINNIVDRVIESPCLFQEIYALTKDKENKIAWRALWACEKLSQKAPYLFVGMRDEIISSLLKTSHDGMKRLYLNIILSLPQAESINIKLLDYCFEKMLSFNEASSCQAACMKIAFKECLKEKDLLNELELYLENMETSFYKAAAISTRNSILKKIKK